MFHALNKSIDKRTSDFALDCIKQLLMNNLKEFLPPNDIVQAHIARSIDHLYITGTITEPPVASSTILSRTSRTPAPAFVCLLRNMRAEFLAYSDGPVGFHLDFKVPQLNLEFAP